MTFSEEYFNSLSKRNTFCLPKRWSRPERLTLIPHTQNFVSMDFFEQREVALRDGKTLKDFWSECQIQGKCVLGFYGDATPKSLNKVFEPVTRSIRTKQVVPLDLMRGREVRLDDCLIRRLSSVGGTINKLFLQPRGETFCIWDADYYMNDPQLNNSIDLRHAVALLKREQRRIVKRSDRQLAA